MSALRISAYLQRHPQAGTSRIAHALGISTKTVYRHRLRTEAPLPTWEVSELALRVWLALGDVGTLSNLQHDLGVSRATIHRGLAELKGAGLLVSFRSPTTGSMIYRRREEPVRDPFSVFGQHPEPTDPDPFEARQDKSPRPTVAGTADLFAGWVRSTWPSTPYQSNRKALMSALARARKENGVTDYQEKTALAVWISRSPRPLGHVPLWRQFLAAYPAIVQEVPRAAPVPAPPRDQTAQRERRAAMEAFEQTLEMARSLDRELKDRDYPVWLERYERKALYYQRVARGAALSDPWEPPMSPPPDDLGTGGVVADHGLDGHPQEGPGDPGADDWSGFFEEEDVSAYYHDEDDSHHDAGV